MDLSASITHWSLSSVPTPTVSRPVTPDFDRFPHESIQLPRAIGRKGRAEKRTAVDIIEDFIAGWTEQDKERIRKCYHGPDWPQRPEERVSVRQIALELDKPNLINRHSLPPATATARQSTAPGKVQMPSWIQDKPLAPQAAPPPTQQLYTTRQLRAIPSFDVGPPTMAFGFQAAPVHPYTPTHVNSNYFTFRRY
jgi:hypothetical protein